MLTAELRIDDGSMSEIHELIAGRGEVQITVVSFNADTTGHERHDLEPLRVEALAATASSDPAVDVCGALVRVFTRPCAGDA